MMKQNGTNGDLTDYRKKRDFGKSAEPTGRAGARSGTERSGERSGGAKSANGKSVNEAAVGKKMGGNRLGGAKSANGEAVNEAAVGKKAGGGRSGDAKSANGKAANEAAVGEQIGGNRSVAERSGTKRSGTKQSGDAKSANVEAANEATVGEKAGSGRSGGEKFRSGQSESEPTGRKQPRIEKERFGRSISNRKEKGRESAERKSDEIRAKLKFAVQLHDASRLHYDFRLEWNGVLLSWAVPKGPSYLPKDKRLAVKVENHPVEYASFEGTIPKGEYGGGTVMLWDEGTWEPVGDAEEGLGNGSLKFLLYGKRLKGRWALVRLRNGDGDYWLLIKDKDEYAQTTDGIGKFDKSVVSGKSLEKIAADASAAARKNPFAETAPQLAKLVDTIPKDEDLVYEIKYDGYRILAFAEDGAVRLASRNNADYTEKFPPVADALSALSKNRAMVFDGEMTVSNRDGKSDFGALQEYVKKPSGKRLAYMIFDLLALDGKDLRTLPLSERKERLAALLKDAEPPLFYSRHVVGNGEKIFRAAAETGLEGIVGKRADAPYYGKRDGSWIKIKCYLRQEFVIGGYTESERKEGGIAALLLGYYDKTDLRYAGRAGTGIGSKTAEELKRAFAESETNACPFADAPDVGKSETVRYVKPNLVAEIQFAERTKENRLRQASFKGLRSDKKPEEVVWEEPESDLPKNPNARRESPPTNPPKRQSNLPKQSKLSNKSVLPKQSELSNKSKSPNKSKLSNKSELPNLPKQPNLPNKSESPNKSELPNKSESPNKSKQSESPNKSELPNKSKSPNKSKQSNLPNKSESTKGAGQSGIPAKKEGKRNALKNGTAEVCGIKISNPDKIVFDVPEMKKIDVIRYYEKVSERMLPLIERRLVSVVRCHDGVKADCYFKKHPDRGNGNVDAVSVMNAEGERSDYFSVNDKSGIISEVQSGTIEFHFWGSRIETLERPDVMVFDLDPDEGMSLEKIRRGVRDLKSVLDGLGLKSFLKTSGGKGYHVVVPFRPEADWDAFHDFARRVAEVMEAKWPDRYTSNIRKSEREGKIFIDWIRNGRGATSVAPYSLRARPGAKVSMPIAWGELDTVAPDGIDAETALARLKKRDPWKDFRSSENRPIVQKTET